MPAVKLPPVVQSIPFRKVTGYIRKVRFPLLLLLTLFFQSAPGQQSSFPQLDLLQGKKKVTIPFNYVNNFIILDVKIFGSIPVHLIFDTGTEHVILFKRQYTDLMQIEYDRRIPVVGSDLSREIYALITRNSMVEVSGLRAMPADLLVLEEDYFNLEEMVGTSIDGLIGGGYLKNLIIQIDYRRYKMTLYDPRYFETPPGYTIIPLKIKINKPYIDAEASLQDGSVVQVDLLVDTGAGVPLLLHTNSHPSLKLPDHFIRGRLGMGLGGYLEGYIGRINNLSVGGIDFPSIITSFQEIKDELLLNKNRFRNGILGNQLLSRFTVYFDYNRCQLIVKPYRSRQRPFKMDKSGLVLVAFGLEFNHFIVKDVIPGSPAAEADIRPDDVIIRVQGLPGTIFTLSAVNSILQKKAGKRIRMVIRRGEIKLEKEFYLRDLI